MKAVAWRVLVVAGVVLGATMLWLSSVWQRELHALMGLPAPSRWGYPAGLVVSVPVGFALVGVARLGRRTTQRVARPLARWIPARAAAVVAAVLVTVAVVAFLDGVAGRALFAAADAAFRFGDRVGGLDHDRPTSALRSGGPGSGVAWEELGSHGRAFVAGGPGTSRITAFNSSPATAPIRVYVGQASRADVQARAELVVDELERTGAFDRAVLCVMTPTGMGWIDPVAADALEYLWDGDTALAGMQYSSLPSWLSHLVDASRAHDAGAALFDAVHHRWEQLPPASRPKLVTFGESLGADGSQFAFSGLADVRNRTDGALWVGPPNFSGLWRSLTAERDPGSPAYEPVYERGATVRFVDDRGDLATVEGWTTPRVVFLENPTDPVVWWTPRLLLNHPDWLRGPRGPGVVDRMRWYPLVTFWQVTADLANARTVPPGYGHNYATLPAAAWASILPPPGWTAADTARLEAELAPLATIPPSG